MRPDQTIYKCAVLTALLGMGGCNFYEDNFTAEGKFYKSVNGAYGLTSNCAHEALFSAGYDESLRPDLMVIDYYMVDERSCSLDEIVKDGEGFILKPALCTGNRKWISEWEFTYEEINLFEVRVEALEKDKVVFQETGKEPVTVYRCGT